MKKRRPDNDIIIDVLEEAARRSHSDEPLTFKQYGAAELPIVLDLIEAGKVRGMVGERVEGQVISLESITLEGRQLRDELIERRNSKRFIARLKAFGLLVLGWVGGLLTTAIKALIEHFFK